MVYINLLPVREIKRRRQAKKQIFSFLFGFLCLLLLLAVLVFWQTNVANGRQAKLNAIQAEKQKYDITLKKIKQLEEEKLILENQISIIEKLKQSSSLTVHVLDEVANFTPSKRMWLTSLSQSGKDLSINGMALDNRTIAKYMDELKTSEYIQEVSLANTALKSFAGRNLKTFSISCTLAVPGEESGSDAEQTTK